MHPIEKRGHISTEEDTMAKKEPVALEPAPSVVWSTTNPPPPRDAVAAGYKIATQHLRMTIYAKSVDDFENLELAVRTPGRDGQNQDKHNAFKRKMQEGIIYPTGGWCIVDISAPDGRTYQGRARCSIKDMYNYRLAFRIAYGRAIAKMTDSPRFFGSEVEATGRGKPKGKTWKVT